MPRGTTRYRRRRGINISHLLCRRPKALCCLWNLANHFNIRSSFFIASLCSSFKNCSPFPVQEIPSAWQAVISVVKFPPNSHGPLIKTLGAQNREIGAQEGPEMGNKSPTLPAPAVQPALISLGLPPPIELNKGPYYNVCVVIYVEWPPEGAQHSF